MSLARTGLLLSFTLFACGESESSGSGGASGAGAAGSGGGAAAGGIGGTGSSSGGGTAGASGSSCLAPDVVTSVTGAVFPKPGEYQGSATPELDLDGPDPKWTWNDPHVLRVGAQYWMYASATNDFVFPVVSYRLVSSDGKSWKRDPAQPILAPGAAGSWDGGGIETPAVAYFAGQYHLFYTGYATKVGDPGHSVLEYRVGHATSCDGVVWQRGATPIVAPSGSDADANNDWYAFIVAEPGPVVVGGALHLYFTAVGANAKLGRSLQVVGVVTSSDGVSWSAPKLVLEPDQGLYPRVTDAGPPVAGWFGYSTPNAVVLNGQVHLFVDVAFDPDEAHWQQIRLHHAVSPDGLGAFVQDSQPIAKAGDFPWAKTEIRSPHALLEGTTLRLWFAGHELDGVPPDHFAIGSLSADLTP